MNNIDLINAIVSGDKQAADDMFQIKMNDVSYNVLDAFKKQVSAVTLQPQERVNDDN